MLKNIDPLLNAEVLYALRAMGHGDTLVVSDMNFPSDSVASETVHGELLRIDASAARVVEAITSVMPLDSFIEHPAQRMEVVGAPDQLEAVQQEVQDVLDKNPEEGVNSKLAGIERFAFYEAAKNSYCVITTAERRFYGCFIFTKGVIAPE